jgi:CheY-like chemotaxis protein
MTTHTQPTILLIDNHPQFPYLIKRYGELSGCRVINAGTVDAALELMTRDQPTLIILHLLSWPPRGQAVLQTLFDSCDAGDIPITIISALADEERARNEGADYWLWQPVLYTDFLDALLATGVLASSTHHRLSEQFSLDNKRA